MTTLSDLIDGISASLHSYTGVQEQSTYLTESVAAGDLTLPVADSSRVMRGIAEVGDELLYVDASDGTSINCPPFGRGYRGTEAASHAANTQITFDPVFPRKEIRRAISQCIAALYPSLYAIKHTDLDYSPVLIGYELPADVENVLEVKVQHASLPYDYWMPVYAWNFDPTSPDGKVLNLFDEVIPGATIRVVYQGRFSDFASDDAELTSTGLEESCADLIEYAVAARMVRFLDPARLQTFSVENATRSQLVNPGDAGKIANQLYALYQQRLTEERRKLLDLYPTRINFTR